MSFSDGAAWMDTQLSRDAAAIRQPAFGVAQSNADPETIANNALVSEQVSSPATVHPFNPPRKYRSGRLASLLSRVGPDAPGGVSGPPYYCGTED